MSRHRLYWPEPLLSGSECALSPERAHYLRNVLRLRVGDELVLFDGRGNEIEARLVALDRRDTRVTLGDALDPVPEPPLEVTLVQGISRGERMDWTLQKATELGVSRIIPVITARSEVKLNDDRRRKRLAHWQGVIVSACEQCGRNRLPVLDEVGGLETLPAFEAEAMRFYLDPEAERGLRGRLRPDGPVVVCVGPEGGFDPSECERLAGLGFEGLRLGPRILRTETAGPAILAALQAFWGDLG